jgi:hypothetical protein
VPQNVLNPVTLGRAINDEPRLQATRDSDPVVRRAFDIVQRLEGLTRHASTHAAGIVIGDRPLTELVPLYRDPKSSMPVTQFNMKWVEPAGKRAQKPGRRRTRLYLSRNRASTNTSPTAPARLRKSRGVSSKLRWHGALGSGPRISGRRAVAFSVAACASERSLQAYLGHKNIQHTVRYTELWPTRFKDFWRN